ncbi:MAG: ABC transporter ATP-binding protein [Bacteroidota bacterium]
MNTSSIKIKDLSFSYRDKVIFEQANFTLQSNHIYGLIGPNGVGKTTLISILAGIQKKYKGLIENIDRPGLLLQGTGFYENLTVAENLNASKFDKKCTSIEVDQVLSLVKMTEYRTVKFSNLSQGYKQRLGIARSLLTDGNLVLLDEPFTAVDVQTVRLLKKAIVDYVANTKKIVVISSHQLKTIDDLIDQPLMIKSQQVQSFDLNKKRQKSHIIYLWLNDENSMQEVENNSAYVEQFNRVDDIVEITLSDNVKLKDFIEYLDQKQISWRRLDKEMPLEFFYFKE